MKRQKNARNYRENSRRGKAMDKKKSTVILRMPAERKEQLHTEAMKKGISFNAYVLPLIDQARRYRPE